jgi:citrate lyase subunit beta/citryl-CoA lyase
VWVTARSYLYVPGDRPDRFAKALASGAGAVIFDLEDAVPLAAKDDALAAVTDILGDPGPAGSGNAERWVRINAGPRGLVDLAALGDRVGLTGVFIPKATPDALRGVISSAPGPVRVTALVESALAVLRMEEIAATERVVQLALGEVDLAADLGMSPSPDGDELAPIRVGAVVASSAYGCAPPVGPVWVDIRDTGGLAGSTRALRALGFGARQAIHPSQVEVIEAAMSPTDQERAAASRLLELAERAGGGACVDEDGRMIDEAVLRSARRILAD